MVQHPDINLGIKVPHIENLPINPFIRAGNEDPSVEGSRGNIGSIFIRTIFPAQVFLKFGTGNTDWIELGGEAPIQIGADQYDNPNNANWAVNALAPAVVDPTNNALTVRAFDDTTEEGVGFGLTIPEGANAIEFTIISRPDTGPAAGMDTVGINLYVREVPDGAAVPAFGPANALGSITFPAGDEFFQYETFTILLATLGVSAGSYVQFEMTRDTAVGDNLTGDWLLLQSNIVFS